MINENTNRFYFFTWRLIFFSGITSLSFFSYSFLKNIIVVSFPTCSIYFSNILFNLLKSLFFPSIRLLTHNNLFGLLFLTFLWRFRIHFFISAGFLLPLQPFLVFFDSPCNFSISVFRKIEMTVFHKKNIYIYFIHLGIVVSK
jgi:hypothetical protein